MAVDTGTEPHPAFIDLANLRQAGAGQPLPEGTCLYIQSGDPSDFDGYLAAAAGHAMAECTRQLTFAVVVPERRATSNRSEADLNAHDPEFSNQVMHTAGRLLQALCPSAFVVFGPLNQRNIIPQKFITHEPEKYAPVLGALRAASAGCVRWESVGSLARLVESKEVTSVMLDMLGAVGYLDSLAATCPSLGPKVKASGLPLAIMAGILAEAETTTLRMPGRDPRSTMNAIYHQPTMLLSLAQQHSLPLLFVTNNAANSILKFEDDKELVSGLGLQGTLKLIAECWYGPHLKGKYVPFDWVALVALLLVNRYPTMIRTERRQLWVGKADTSVLVLKLPGAADIEVARANLEGAVLWGEVDSVTHIDRSLLCHLARQLSERQAHC
ncbi:hypothetical protein WJX72_002851 [[Myrmecia] bisecta]|uniref:Uncharacterized protein n=1 Tax=[Myrmecia] bisecta TaxID=41462 RepID=A0AAW1P939_9CHLO